MKRTTVVQRRFVNVRWNDFVSDVVVVVVVLVVVVVVVYVVRPRRCWLVVSYQYKHLLVHVGIQ